jgi:hypothetical protein
LPEWIRKFITDAVESSIEAVLLLNWVIPGDLNAAKAQMLVAGAAVAGALVPAIRRAVPPFIAWLRERLGTT